MSLNIRRVEKTESQTLGETIVWGFYITICDISENDHILYSELATIAGSEIAWKRLYISNGKLIGQIRLVTGLNRCTVEVTALVELIST